MHNRDIVEDTNPSFIGEIFFWWLLRVLERNPDFNMIFAIALFLNICHDYLGLLYLPCFDLEADQNKLQHKWCFSFHLGPSFSPLVPSSTGVSAKCSQLGDSVFCTVCILDIFTIYLDVLPILLWKSGRMTILLLCNTAQLVEYCNTATLVE